MAVDIVIGLDTLALVFAIGLSATHGLLVPTAGFQQRDLRRIRRTTVRLFCLSLAVLWLTSLAWLWTRTAAMAGQPLLAAWPIIPKVLFHSHFGSIWWLRAAAISGATVGLVLVAARGTRTRWFGVTTILFGLAWIAASRSAAGHAAAHGDWTWREGMDWLHLMSVSVWGGSLMASLLLVFPRLGQVGSINQARFAKRFSLVATIALAGVLSGGIYNAWQLLPSPAALWYSYYGRVLGIKLLFVAGMLACGGVNHYRLVPRLQATAPDNTTVVHQFQASVVCEAVLLLVVIAVTAVLLGSAPPVA